MGCEWSAPSGGNTPVIVEMWYERLWEARRDNSGTGRSQERLSTWRTQCPTPSGLPNRASGPLVLTTSPPQRQSNVRLPFSQKLALPARPWGPAGPPRVSRSASEPRARRHRSGQKQRPTPGRKTAPLWVRPGSPAPPGPSLSSEGTGGARKALLPPG